KPYRLDGLIHGHDLLALVPRNKQGAVLHFGHDLAATGIVQPFSHDGSRFAWGTEEGSVHVLDFVEVRRRLTEISLGWGGDESRGDHAGPWIGLSSQIPSHPQKPPRTSKVAICSIPTLRVPSLDKPNNCDSGFIRQSVPSYNYALQINVKQRQTRTF